MKKIIGMALFLLPFSGQGKFMMGNVDLEQETAPQVRKVLPLVKKLYQTEAQNLDEIYEQLNLRDEETSGLLGGFRSQNERKFLTNNPYYPAYFQGFNKEEELKYPLPQRKEEYEIAASDGNPFKKTIHYYAREHVVSWFSNLKNDTSVCAVKFLDSQKKKYRLQTFSSPSKAKEAGYIITHHYQCGMCSTLKDLAVYMGKPDLTAPARKCTTKLILNRGMKCMRDQIGFTQRCSEQWAYNAKHTKSQCMGICMRYYKIWNIVLNRYDKFPNVDEEGNLNPCIACDEYKSGPGFKFGAGRTRRNSGLTSAIQRRNNEVKKVDHTLYFKR